MLLVHLTFLVTVLLVGAVLAIRFFRRRLAK